MRLSRALVVLVCLSLLLVLIRVGSGSDVSAQAQASLTDGKFVWQDLVTTNPTAARRFYSSLLGWQFSESKRNGRSYLIARTKAGPVAGIVDISDLKDAGTQWVSYASVANVDRIAQQVVAGGGKVLVPPADLKAGRAAVVADPQGAVLGLIQPAIKLPDDPAPVMNHFFWHEYLAQDGAKALAFYKGLFGYQSEIADTQIGIEYSVLKRDKPLGGLFQIPAAVTQVRPNWLAYVLVDDPRNVVSRVAGLGGRVLLEPAPDRRAGSLAIVADPSGGAVAVQKFPF